MFNCDLVLKECKARCCGIISFDREFYEKHKDKAQRESQIVTEKNGEQNAVPVGDYCIFLTKDLRCAIYDERPDICREYGLNETKIPCAYLKSNGKPRSEAGRKKFQRIINHQVDEALRSIKRRYKNENLQ